MKTGTISDWLSYCDNKDGNWRSEVPPSRLVEGIVDNGDT